MDTEDKRIEARPMKSEEATRALLNALPVGIAVTNLDGKISEVNPALLEMFGYDSREEFLDLNASTLYHDPGDRERRLELSSDWSSKDFEARLKRKGGSFFWASITSITQKDEGGKTRFINVVKDITKRKQAEEELLRERDYSESIVNSLPGAFFLFDDTGIFVRWNKNFEKVSGYSTEEISRMSPIDFFRDEGKGRIAEKIREIFSKGGSSIEANVLTKTGKEIPYYLTGNRIFLAGIPHLAGMGIDISERRYLEEQLHQSRKMEAIGKLAGGVAHDFNNLLTIVMGYADTLLHGKSHQDPDYPIIEDIFRAGQRAAALTNQLLAFARKQMLQPKALDLNDIITDMNGMLKRIIGEDIELACLPGPDLGKVRADPGQIGQVVMNLVLNARDAMPDGGRLTIETTNLLIDKGFTDPPPGVSAGRHVVLAVSDTGCGMDDETRMRIFEPFFTTKEKSMGTGLGLSTVYGIVKQSGGNISVSSKPGEGTNVRIHFPRFEGVSEPHSVTSDPDGQPAGNETILLVEDDKAVRTAIRKMLKRSGYEVLEAGGGEEALHAFERHGESIDLLVTDVVMPGMSGTELAGRLSEIRPDLKVLYMSGYTDEAIGHRGIPRQGENLINKPFITADLAFKVREVLDVENEE